MIPETLTREALQHMSTGTYLRAGFLEPGGEPRAPLQGMFALAAAAHLREYGTTPDALEAAITPVFQRARQLRTERDVHLLRDALLEASVGESAAAQWLKACIRCVTTPDEVPALLLHVESTLRMLTTLGVLHEVTAVVHAR